MRTSVRVLIKKNFRDHPKNPNFIEVRGMEVEKLKEKNEGSKNRIQKYFYSRDEPLVPIILD